MDADAATDSGDGVGDELLPGLAAAAVGERVCRDGRWEPLLKGPLCAVMDGFSLHAGAWVSARDREKLEKVCRYAARPAVAESRLVELSDGRIGYSLKKRWRDGTTAVVMTKEVLMKRLRRQRAGAEAAQASGDESRGAGGCVGAAFAGGAAASGGGRGGRRLSSRG